MSKENRKLGFLTLAVLTGPIGVTGMKGWLATVGL